MRGRRIGLGLIVAGLACGEGGRGEREQRAEPERTRPLAIEAGRDTASAVSYEIFESKVETEHPRRLTLRILVFEPQNAAGVTKSVRAAFDSVAATDAQVVAARAIVYAPRPRGSTQVDLVPIGWAVWVPPEGWDSAGAGSRPRIHRTHVYFGAALDPAIFGDVEP